MSGLLDKILSYVHLNSLTDYFKGFLGGINSPNLNIGSLGGIFVIIVILLFAFSLGKSRMYLGLLSLYVAGFAVERFPYFDTVKGYSSYLNSHSEFYTRIVVFGVFYFLSFFILNRSFLKSRMLISDANLFEILLIIVVDIGFLVSILIPYAPDEIKGFIPGILLPYLSSAAAQFAWAAAPIVIVLFFKRRSY